MHASFRIDHPGTCAAGTNVNANEKKIQEGSQMVLGGFRRFYSAPMFLALPASSIAALHRARIDREHDDRAFNHPLSVRRDFHEVQAVVQDPKGHRADERSKDVPPSTGNGGATKHDRSDGVEFNPTSAPG